MSLRGLLPVTIGVPNVEETTAYYAEFGLAPAKDGAACSPGDRRPALVPAPRGPGRHDDRSPFGPLIASPLTISW